MRPKLIGGRRLDACLRLFRRLAAGEDGIALVMALGVMTILTIALTTVVFLTAAGARDAQRTNAGQKAYALAEAGINNAVGVLDANYPGTTQYPGVSTLLPTTTTTYSSTTSVTWGGSLVQAPASAGWGYQWNLTATGTVTNPTGPTAQGAGAVTRTVTAVVPVVIQPPTSGGSSISALNMIYGNNINFSQSSTIDAPIYATGDLTLNNTGGIVGTIPATPTAPSQRNTLYVGGSLSLVQPNDVVGSSSDPLLDVEVAGNCSSKFYGTHRPCGPSGTKKNTDPIWADDCAPLCGTSPPAITAPTMTASEMATFYNGADLGPNSPCDPSQSSGGSALPTFDNDTTMNGSAYSQSSPFQLIGGSSYRCISKGGNGELIWDSSNKSLYIKGTIFIDGSVTTNGGTATYSGNGRIVLDGVFTMSNGDALCAVSGCSTTASWNPNQTSIGIVAYGADSNTPPNSIVIKKGQFQGFLMGLNSIDINTSGAMVQGPVISVSGNVYASQSALINFPAVFYTTNAFQGFSGPTPLPTLLPPIQFGGG